MSRPNGAFWTALAAAMVISLGLAAGAVSSAPQGAAPTGHAARGAVQCTSGPCYVAVSVATLWVKPWYPRSIDQPALGNPAEPRTWIGALTDSQKAWLVGKLETQALYRTRVIVIGRWRGWLHVTVPSQPTNRDPSGYPGWVPAVQLTRVAPVATGMSAVVSSPTAWLWTRWVTRGVAGTHVMLASYGTSLPVLGVGPRSVRVALLAGHTAAIRRSDVRLHATGSGWGATRARVVAEARKFLGLQYLWGGTSGLGYDCSGLAYAVYHEYGITLSRDADQQAVHGTVVSRRALAPGDLVFFRSSAIGPIDHVGIFVGDGNMIDAPHTGAPIRLDAIASFPYYAGARRYLSR